MSYSKKEVIERSAYIVSANSNGDKIDTRDLFSGSFGITWTGGSAADATVKLQESWDGTTWNDRVVPSTASVTLDAASGQKKIAVADVDVPYLRVVVTKNTETTAALTVRYYLKGAR